MFNNACWWLIAGTASVMNPVIGATLAIGYITGNFPNKKIK